VTVYSRIGGHAHKVSAEQAAYLLGQHDPITGQALYIEGKGDGSLAYEGAAVTEAAFGVPDDAIPTDAAAMAERGGQPKGSTAGPTIPQDARKDRGKRADAAHPLARGQRASGDVEPPPGSVREDVAARHEASMNNTLPEGGATPTDEAEAAARLNEQAEE
jgi:hypothetical protein